LLLSSKQGLVGAGINICAFTMITERFAGRTRLAVLAVNSTVFMLATRIIPAIAGRSDPCSAQP